MKNRLLKLQTSLDVRKGRQAGHGLSYVPPNQDYYTNYAINDLLDISTRRTNMDFVKEAYENIGNSLSSSKQTKYFVEYSEGYRAVYEFLVNCPHDWEYIGHSHNDDAYQCSICGELKYE